MRISVRMSFILSPFNLPTMEQNMFPPFDSMFSLFWVFFIIVAVVIVLSFVLTFWRMIKGGKTQEQTYSEPEPPVSQREIIREIVKIRCSYCGNLYDETQDKCPYCGAKR
jgi:flagellar basal body-associated protein FliL